MDLRMEAESCYRAAGIAYASESELSSRARGLLYGGSRLGDSSWQSLARATGSIETDFLNGEIVLLGRLHRRPDTPQLAAPRLGEPICPRASAAS